MVLTRSGTVTDTAAGVSSVTENRESESSKSPRAEKLANNARAETTTGASGATDASGASTATEGTMKPACQEGAMKRIVTRSDTGLPVRDPVRTKPRATSHKSKSKKSNRHRELLAARAALLEKEVQLQAARVTLLELEESEEDEDEEVDSVSSEERHERTKNWIEEQDAQLEEHRPVATGEGSKGIVRQPSPARRFDPQPQDRVEGPSLASQPHSRSEIKELAEAITAAARSAAPVVVTVPSAIPELPSFNGSSSDWLPFVAAYEEIAARVKEADILSRLRRCLTGAAKEAAHCLFVGKPTSAEVMNLLRRRFGRPRALVKVEMEKLRALPKVSDNPRDVCIFASRVASITATVKALDKKQYLDYPEVVETVVDKLPSALRYRFYDFAATNDEAPELVKLDNFLQQLAERAGTYAPAETVAEDRREKEGAKSSRRTTPAVRTYHAVTTSASTAEKSEECCKICSEKDHQPASCPKMIEADVDRRWELAREYRLCFRCLRPRKFRHQCKFKRCDVSGCKGTHHSMLHGSKLQVEQPPPPAKEEPETAVVTSAREAITSSALLKVLPVRVAGPSGACDTYALLDDGSTCTLIDAALAEKIGADGPSQPFFIEGVAGARVDARTSRRVKFEISGRNSRPFTVSARTIDQLDLTAQTISSETVRRFPHLQDLEEELTYVTGRPAVLVGQDNWHLLLAHEVRRGERDQPVASLTDLGWVLHGIRDSLQRAHRILHIRVREREEDEMERLMREHFALESLAVTPRRSYNDEEQRALQILTEKTKRLPAGGFETGLLWRSDNPSPPDNYSAAFKRLQLIEKKLDKDPQLKERYNRQMEVLFENNYAEPAPAEKSKKIWYLPHFAVINPQKPQKLRIVHDAAARTKGTSLNDMLLSGPDLLQSLPGVLMRFRQRPVAVTADIKDMFMRVQVVEEDREMQRFLWRGDRRTGTPTEYRMKSVIFGATSSPCTAIYVKNMNAEHYKEEFPDAAAAIVNNHYVDDYIASFNNEDDAIRVSSQVMFVHSRANFFLQRWASNSRIVVSTLSPGKREDVVALDAEKILGMVWHPATDTLTFNVNIHKIPAEIMSGEKTPTKREALRTVMSIFDPLGLATPVTIQAKRILQDTWRSGIEWDEALRKEEDAIWKSWVAHIQRLQQLVVPRCYPHLITAGAAELHVFVDASTSTYAAAVYWRVVDQAGDVHITLVTGKGRVAPLNKVTSVPRLELQAAVLGCRLARTAIDEHDIKPSRRVFWCDSRTVLAWLRTGPRAYKPFVAHRVAEIAEETKTKEWRWVPTKYNVADDATRETPDNFTSEHRWFRGPSFLYEPEEAWPREDDHHKVEEIEEAAAEERTHVAVAAPRLREALPDITRFSNFQRVLRATARVVQFIEMLRERQRCAVTYKRTAAGAHTDATWRPLPSKKKTRIVIATAPRVTNSHVPLEVRHLRRATELWVRSQQEDTFALDIAALRRGAPLPSASRLTSLAVVMGDDGIIRLKSRIARAADITACQSEPAIIDGDHPWTRLYIAWVHSQLHHAGFETTTTEVRQQYWVLRLRYAVRSVLKRCLVCRIRRATPTRPSTGNHPVGRLAHHQRPFTYTGIDYFGPLYVTVGRGKQKRYGALFTCLTTRAVHIEVAGSLSTDSAIMALRRFISRRGCPTELWSDQGTNLKGADQELKKAAAEAMRDEATVRGIEWRYIPPSAPFMGGAWERLVRSIKTALQVTLHERAPKEEVLTTLMAEAEHTVNSRPLTHVSTSPDDDEPLTPNHFLLGGPSRVPLPGTFTEGDVAGRKEWRTSQRLADMFWARWVKEYLPELQHRREPRPRGRAIRENDLVLMADGTLPRNQWPRGVVVRTFPGPDGEVRAVDVRTSKGVLRRPTKKLVLLPGPDSE